MPFVRRVGRPGLIGTAARTAVIAGTASATAGAVRRHQDNRAQASFEQQQYEAQQQQAAYEQAAREAATQQPTAAPSPSESPLVAQLRQLAELHAQGVLDDAEFAAAKAKLLA